MRSRKSTAKEGNDKPVGGEETKATVTTVKAKDKTSAQGKKGRDRDDNDAKNAKETVTCKQQEMPYRTLVYIFFPICLMSPEITKALFDFWKQNFFVLCGVFCYTWLRFLQWVVVPDRRRNELSPVWKTLCFMVITVGAVSMLPFNKTAYILEKKLLEPEECDWIINTVEEATQQMGWETSRHRYHSTEDIPADDIPEIKDFMDKVVEERLQPMVNMVYNGKMEVFDMFIVRYKIGRQVSLSEHTDAGQVSFDIILSSPKDFEVCTVRSISTTYPRSCIAQPTPTPHITSITHMT
mmetsp:Transcript_28868/g.50793  ORF Transcript_28868/g.50793 Transcript_28868/m.50793 type:complete len:295 (+) Transcript_28868:152-1036(+)